MANNNNVSPFSKILVGIDPSENSYRAFEYAMRLSKMCNAKVYLLFVTETFVGISELEKSLEEEAQKLVEDVVGRMAKQSDLFPTGNIEKIILKGHTSKTILDFGKSIRADLIIVGSRGLGGAKELLLGSVSHAVSRHATVPVLIVK